MDIWEVSNINDIIKIITQRMRCLLTATAKHNYDQHIVH